LHHGTPHAPGPRHGHRSGTQLSDEQGNPAVSVRAAWMGVIRWGHGIFPRDPPPSVPLRPAHVAGRGDVGGGGIVRSAGIVSREIEGNHDRTDQASAKLAAVLTADAARLDDCAVRLAGLQGQCGAATEGSGDGDYKVGGDVWFDYQLTLSPSGSVASSRPNALPHEPIWLRSLFGDNFFHKVLVAEAQPALHTAFVHGHSDHRFRTGSNIRTCKH
jgi:hypothetical protein